MLEACIHFGRQYKQSGDSADEYEAFRLLGQAVRGERAGLIDDSVEADKGALADAHARGL